MGTPMKLLNIRIDHGMVRILGAALLTSAVMAGLALEACGLVFTETGRSSTITGTATAPVFAEEVHVSPNWPVALPLALIALAGLTCLILSTRRRVGG